MNSTQVNERSRPPAYVIDTTEDPAAVDRVRHMLGNERVEFVSLPDLRDSNSWEALNRVRMVITAWSGDSRMPIAAPSKLASVHLLPALAVCRTAPSAAGIDALRRHGVSACVEDHASEHRPMHALLRSTHWFSAQLSRMSVADAVQILAADNRSGVLVLACPHCRPLAFRPWRETPSLCSGDDRCGGAVARVYVVDGNPVHAETSGHQGMTALSQALSFNAGVARFCEVFLPPSVQTLEGTASQLLIAAATLTDERRRQGPPRDQRRARPVLPPRSDEASTSMSTAQILKRQYPSASLVVCADTDGGVRDVAGSGDGEGLAAVASITNKAFENAASQLGLGQLQGWTMTAEQTACFVSTASDELAVAFMTQQTDGFRKLDAFLQAAQASKAGH